MQYIYYCAGCKKINRIDDSDENLKCPRCKTSELYPTDISYDNWIEYDLAEKARVLDDFAGRFDRSEDVKKEETAGQKDENTKKESIDREVSEKYKKKKSGKVIRIRKDQRKWVDEVTNGLRKKEKQRKKKAQKDKEDISSEINGELIHTDEEVEHPEKKHSIFNPKVTNLLFYRQYNTYQALLEAYPQNGMSVSDCFSKIILYIMKWFKDRIGEEGLTSVPEVSFLNTDYPDPEQFGSFDINNTKDINALSVIDVKTAYMDKKDAWMFQLVEPDNGNENRDIHGRVFTTNICVYKKAETVVFGVRTSCKEPVTNTVDADVYRPAFIRTIFRDTDIEISEAGVPYEYRFKDEPTMLNGKSSADCNDLYDNLIANPNRQLPVLFVPEDFYYNADGEKRKDKIDGKTVSYLGFCHVVVWTKSNQKLFGQAMDNQELVDVSSEGQLIIYRSNPGRSSEVEPSYFEADDEDLYTEIDSTIKKADPLRRTYDFREYDLVADHWDTEKVLQLITSGDMDNSEEVKLINAERDRLKARIEELDRDNQDLQQRNEELGRSNDKLEKERNKAVSDVVRIQNAADEYKQKYKQEKEEYDRLQTKCITYEMMIDGAANIAKEKFMPLLHFPRFEKGAKEEILNWIDEYYSDKLIIHDNARKSFLKDNRNLDWRMFCMMIHYLAGYTYYRNEGAKAMDKTVARDYDPDGYGFVCTPTSTGSSGSKNIYSSDYTVNISEYDDEEDNVSLDMHIAKGKGRDDDMIRIYFYYDANIKKSIIGYMPDHLRTRSIPH